MCLGMNSPSLYVKIRHMGPYSVHGQLFSPTHLANIHGFSLFLPFRFTPALPGACLCLQVIVTTYSVTFHQARFLQSLSFIIFNNTFKKQKLFVPFSNIKLYVLLISNYAWSFTGGVSPIPAHASCKVLYSFLFFYKLKSKFTDLRKMTELVSGRAGMSHISPLGHRCFFCQSVVPSVFI